MPRRLSPPGTRGTTAVVFAGAAVFLGSPAGMLMAGAFLEDFRLFAVTSFLIAGMHTGTGHETISRGRPAGVTL